MIIDGVDADDVELGWREFEFLWKKIEPITLLNKYKAELIYNLFHKYKCVLPHASVAEFGVFRGGISVMLAKLQQRMLLHSPYATVWAFDGFQGIPPESGPNDTGHYQTGHMIHSEVALRNTIREFNVDNYVKVFPGFFKYSVRKAIADNSPHQRFRLVHFDCDLYESTKDALSAIYDRVVEGCPMVFDDYFDQGGGVAKAVNEHIARTGEILFAGYCDQVIIIKGLTKWEPIKDRYVYNQRPPYTPETARISNLGPPEPAKDGFHIHRTLDGILIDMAIPMSNEQYKKDLYDGVLTPELQKGSLGREKEVAERVLNLVDFHFAVLGMNYEP